MKNDEHRALFENVRLEGETIIEIYRPRLIEFIGSSQELWLGIGSIIVFGATFFIKELITPNRLLPLVFFPLLLAILVYPVGAILYCVLRHRNVCYGLSDRRILISDGFLVREFRSIELRHIRSIRLKKNLADLIFGTGSIHFITGDRQLNELGIFTEWADQWHSVRNANQAVKKINQLIQASGTRKQV